MREDYYNNKMTQATWLLLTVVFGLVFGSFLNVVICRIDELETIFLSRSHCPKCKTQLKWYDIIPFFSFIILRTKCRYCRAPISWQYPIVELLTSLTLAFSYWYLVIEQKMSVWAFLPLIVTFGALIICFVYDTQTMMIPVEIVAIGSIFTLISILIRFNWSVFIQGLLGALIMAAIPLFLIVVGKIFFKKEVMGTGDIFLAAAIGLMLNFNLGILAIMAAFIFGGVICISLILFKRMTLGKSEEIAFGPFLIVGGFTALFWGQKILDFYHFL